MKLSLINKVNIYMFLGISLLIISEILFKGKNLKFFVTGFALVSMIYVVYIILSGNYRKLDLATVKIIVGSELFYVSLYELVANWNGNFESISNFTFLITAIFIIFDARENIKSIGNEQINEEEIMKYFFKIFIGIIILLVCLSGIMYSYNDKNYRLLSISLIMFVISIFYLRNIEKDRIEIYEQHENEKNTENIFKSLTPQRIREGMDTYNRAFDFAMANEEVNNIAITGNYGAGKSSVWLTYENDYRSELNNKNCIHISLANFENPNLKNGVEERQLNEGGTEVNTKINKIVEAHIVNQLIHQIDMSKIDFPRFISKDAKNKNEDKIRWAISFVSISVMIIILKNNVIVGLEPIVPQENMWLLKFAISIIPIAILIVSLTYLINKIIEYQFKKPLIKKLSHSNNVIELYEEKDSILDKNLDEIIYLLKESGLKAIVFEDLDRYEDNNIFIKLRGINYLVNRKLEYNKKIKFFYLIKDEMFKAKDRTKFFDFIVPIVPVVDTNNSREELLSTFKNEIGEENNELSRKYLKKLSLYLDDMRIINNIYNEYLIYKEKISFKEKGLKANNLLGIIAYKNIFPKDFSLLQLNRGYVKEVFSKKDDYIRKILNDKELEIKENKIKIKELEVNIEESFVDLVAMYLPSDKSYCLNGENNKDIAKRIIAMNDKNQINYYTRGYTQYQTTTKEQILIELRNNGEFCEKEKKFRDKIKSDLITGIYSEIEKINDEKEFVKLITLSEIIQTNNKNEILKLEGFEEIINNHYYGLISFLIIEGYINESYFEYIGIFKKESLTEADKKFELHVNENIELGYEFKIQNVDEIIDDLENKNYMKKSILNYQILNKILEKKMEKQCLSFIRTIFENNKLDFLDGYFNNDNKNLDDFIMYLNKSDSKDKRLLLSNQQLTNKSKEIFITRTLVIENKNILNNTMKDLINDYLVENINKVFDLVNGSEVEIECISIAIKQLNTKIKELTKIAYLLKTKEVVKNTILVENLYDISFNNIKEVINIQVPNILEEDIINKNYSVLCENIDLESVKNYMEENFEEYIKICNSVSLNHKNNQKYTLDIINSEISKDIIKDYITKSNTIIERLELVRDTTLWDTLMEQKKLDKHYINVLKYIRDRHEITEEILKYINEFTKYSISTIFEDDVKRFEDKNTIEEKLMLDCRVIDSIVNQISKNNNIVFEEIPEEIDNERIGTLINNKKIKLTYENIVKLTNLSNDLMDRFISINLEEFIEMLKINIAYWNNCMPFILNSRNLTDDDKIAILKLYDNPIDMRVGKQVSNDVAEHVFNNNNIIEHNFNYLMENYKDYKCKKAIVSKIKDTYKNVNYSLANEKFIFDCIVNKDISDIIKESIISALIYKNPEKKEKILELIELAKFHNLGKLLKGDNISSLEISQYDSIIKALEAEEYIYYDKDKEKYKVI